MKSEILCLSHRSEQLILCGYFLQIGHITLAIWHQSSCEDPYEIDVQAYYHSFVEGSRRLFFTGSSWGAHGPLLFWRLHKKKALDKGGTLQLCSFSQSIEWYFSGITVCEFPMMQVGPRYCSKLTYYYKSPKLSHWFIKLGRDGIFYLFCHSLPYVGQKDICFSLPLKRWAKSDRWVNGIRSRNQTYKPRHDSTPGFWQRGPN